MNIVCGDIQAANQENYDGSTPARNDVVSLTEEEKENICKQRDFEEFIQRASKIVEKAIGISDLPVGHSFGNVSLSLSDTMSLYLNCVARCWYRNLLHS